MAGSFPGYPVPPDNHKSRRGRKPATRSTVQSVSGYTLVKRPKGTNRVVLTVLDRDGRLLHKMNIHRDEWKEFVKE